LQRPAASLDFARDERQGAGGQRKDANKPADTCHYPDIDLHLPRNDGGFTRKDGTPY
jgi:hypothetical protein